MQADFAFDGIHQSTTSQGCGPYEPSIASSASSSQASIFSDVASVQSSIASSISDDFRFNYDDASDRAYAKVQLEAKAGLDGLRDTDHRLDRLAGKDGGGMCKLQISWATQAQPSYADVTSIPRQQRQHPRRTSLSRCQRPPTLQRQQERKNNFVDNLVDSATQMIEVLWPLSVAPCRNENGCEKAVLPLRSYIEETLRRSKTSYSTLQVALYYLVLIKPYIPKTDFTQEQRMDCPATRALMCGRRMFLAALILASKYLQDRNYSAKAWSKMSGLKVCEINFNERTFLSKISWKLHIPQPLFNQWTEVVLDFTPNSHPPSPGHGLAILPPTWKAVVPLLTPELDKVPLVGPNRLRTKQHPTGGWGLPSPTTPTPASIKGSLQVESTSHETTPTPATIPPRFLEPKPEMEPPALPRMGPLPTPQLTPSYTATGTPAVSASGSRRPSAGYLGSLADVTNTERWPVGAISSRSTYPPLVRRLSATSMNSVLSSPESMISDRSRSSRASSISSVSTVSTTSSWAPNRACLARQATCRSARLPVPPVPEEKEGTATKPIVISDGEDVEIVSSPDMVDFSISEKVMSRPDKHTKHAPQPTSTPTSDKGRKRCRTTVRGNRRSVLQEEVRQMLEEAEEEDATDIEDDYDGSDFLLPSPAADYATRMLSRSNSVIRTKEIQPPASLSRSDLYRKPVQRYEGSKRICSTSAMSISPVPLYGEVA